MDDGKVVVAMRHGRPQKIPEEKWDDVKKDYNRGMTIRELAAKWEVSRGTISKILHSGDVTYV